MDCVTGLRCKQNLRGACEHFEKARTDGYSEIISFGDFAFLA